MKTQFFLLNRFADQSWIVLQLQDCAVIYSLESVKQQQQQS